MSRKRIVGNDNKNKTINIALLPTTWRALLKIGNKGDTFNDIVENLIKRHHILEEIEKEQITGESSADD